MKISSRKFFKNIIHLLLLLQIILGFVFIIRNFFYVPSYGDTTEFLELAQSLKLDDWRPFVYPIFLNLCIGFSNILHISYIPIIYIFQSIFSFLSIFSFVHLFCCIYQKDFSLKYQIFYTLFLWAIPFNIHFNFSIKPDSLATSFTLFFLVFLIYFLYKEKKRYAIITFIFMYIASNIRSEKIYFLCGILFLLILFYCLKRIILKRDISIKKMVILFLLLTLGYTSYYITKSTLQTNSDSARTQPSVISFIYQRVAEPYLADIYQYLPEGITSSISYEFATTSHPAYLGVYEKLLEEDNGNTDRIKEIIHIALQYNYHNVIFDITTDFVKNMFPIAYGILDNHEGMFEYTIQKMQGEHPVFTNAYLIYFNFIILMFFIILIIKRNSKMDAHNIKNFLPCLLYIFISSSFFSCFTTMNFHIRYAFPCYLLEACLLFLFFISMVNQKETAKS